MKIVNTVSLVLASLIMNGFPVHAEQQRHFGMPYDTFEIENPNILIKPSFYPNRKCPVKK